MTRAFAIAVGLALVCGGASARAQQVTGTIPSHLAAAKAAARTRLGLGAEDVVILVLGRLSSFDKMDLGAILAMFARLARTGGQRLCFILAGEDSDNTAKRLLRAASHVELTDRLRIYTNFGSDLREDLYAASDIFLSLADHVQETFGLTILEAMAHGRPVVATACAGTRNLLADGANGLIVPADDAGALAAVLTRLAHEPAIAERLAIAARSTAERFEWRRVQPRLEAAIERWRRR